MIKKRFLALLLLLAVLLAAPAQADSGLLSDPARIAALSSSVVRVIADDKVGVGVTAFDGHTFITDYALVAEASTIKIITPMQSLSLKRSSCLVAADPALGVAICKYPDWLEGMIPMPIQIRDGAGAGEGIAAYDPLQKQASFGAVTELQPGDAGLYFRHDAKPAYASALVNDWGELIGITGSNAVFSVEIGGAVVDPEADLGRAVHASNAIVLYESLHSGQSTADTPELTPIPTGEQPDAPAEQPDAPAEQPETPADQPDAPAEQPESPAEQPESPADQPDAPAEQPETPAEQPEASAEQPAGADPFAGLQDMLTGGGIDPSAEPTPQPEPTAAPESEPAPLSPEESLSSLLGSSAFSGLVPQIGQSPSDTPDASTSATENRPYYEPLERGDSGDAVRKMQTELIALGYLNDSADGSFGPATEAAVRRFNIQNGFGESGIASTAMLEMLYHDYPPCYMEPEIVLEIFKGSNLQYAYIDNETFKGRIELKNTGMSKTVSSFEIYIFARDKWGNDLYGDDIYYVLTDRTIQPGMTGYSEYFYVPYARDIYELHVGLKWVCYSDGTSYDIDDVDYWWWTFE